MKCPLCKGKMAKGKKTNLPYEFSGEKIIVVRNVPALVCGQCGEAFVQINILRRVERILDKAARDGLVMGFVEYEKAA
jgi:YgiT-type zinc finger domain-containing protein